MLISFLKRPSSQERLSRYLTLNESYNSAFSLKLTQRGFYSEINNLLNAVLFGLIRKRQLIVDQSDFGGLKWSDLFASRIPGKDELTNRIDPDWIITHPKQRSFKEIRGSIDKRYRLQLPIVVPQLGIYGSVYRAKRAIAEFLCHPRHVARAPTGPFAAFQIRRGEKLGYKGFSSGGMAMASRKPSLLKDGRWNAEGEDTPLQTYLHLLNKRAPHIDNVFLITDDYRYFDALSALAPNLKFQTLCDPEHRGYYNDEFHALPQTAKTRAIQGLIHQTEVAARSDLFIGEYKSNLSRYIVLRHNNPAKCFSADSQKKWHPR